MTERSALEFPEKIENYDSDRDVILFVGKAADGEITCAISGEALDDHFAARGRGQRARLAAFREHRSEIEDAARRKLEASQQERDGSILIRSYDL